MYTSLVHPLTRQALEERLAAIDRAKICLVGDFCLDLYWHADMRLSELSRETPHYPLPIVEERFSPGGAGNVACNIAALRPAALKVVGLAGTDWRGDLLLRALAEHGIDADGIVRRDEIVTNTYIKPIRHGISDVAYEDPRLDFENRSPLPPDCERALLDALERAAADADVICVSDQMQFGCVTSAVRQRLCRYGEEGRTVVVDSRDRAALYHHVIVKPNEVEAVRAFGDLSEANPTRELAAAGGGEAAPREAADGESMNEAVRRETTADASRSEETQCEAVVCTGRSEGALCEAAICESGSEVAPCEAAGCASRSEGTQCEATICASRSEGTQCEATVCESRSEAVGDGSDAELDRLSRLAAQISLRNGRLALVTLGARGCFVAERGAVTRCPACAVEPPIDFCGAGDTFLAGFGSLLAGGATPLQAVQGANLCSAVTIQKIGTTGTATREEVLRAWEKFCAPET